uniref:Uncharacterized mitochondrial protein AtMg00810-like n=1 Tax=Nicotiana tabacum TaxID=4097 RepID=A0A1S4DAR5_TOBAC|nr:PREDICTED: uncharacterized mitochondrial protein AtMg00810-like [Nicotiana tabacum]
MTDCKPSPSPADSTIQLSKHGETFAGPSVYRSIVGALQYVTITRPEISFSVSRVCQYMHNPTMDHWKAVKRILRYLKGTLTYGLSIIPSTFSSVHVYCDAGWAADPDDRRSHHGFAVYYGYNLISWSSRKQQVVARSSTEAEYCAIAFAASEVSWLTSLLKELQLPCPPAPVVFCDNISAIYFTANPVFHQRLKHIEIDYHFVREKVDRGQLSVRYIPSTDQTADIFTKALSSSRFSQLRSKLNVSKLDMSLPGGVR